MGLKIGFIGLGRMGGNMVLNLAEHGHKVVVYNRSIDVIRKYSRKKNIIASYSVPEMINKLPRRKVIWIMIKAGKPVDDVISSVFPYLNKGDVLIDGGNSFFEDSIRRAKHLGKRGIIFLDCGVSGGVFGARHGACMMVGGDLKGYKSVEVLFKDMCVDNGYGYMGKSGAGHFVKMVHNGIEYGMMGAINEGMQAISKHSKKFGISLREVAKVYSHGSIIEGRLMKWLYDSFNKEDYLDNISCKVPKGETEDEMKKLGEISDMPVLEAARKMRIHSRDGKFCGNFISAMRNQFGGHKFNKK